MLVGSKEVGLEVSADETKYMIMCRDQNAGRCHNIKIDNSSFERVEDFKYLGKPLKKSKFYSRRNKRQAEVRECFLSFGADFLSSNLLSTNLKIQIYRTLILPVALYGCETWQLTLRVERRPRMFEGRVLRRIFGPKKDEGTGEWRDL